MARLAENDFFTNAATPVLIVAVRGNISLGEERLDLDAPFRHITHRTLDGVQVEYRQKPPVFVLGDRPVTIHIPYATPAQLSSLRGIRAGTHVLPVLWSSNLIPTPGVSVVFYEVKSKAHAGATLFQVELTVQAL
jgi:hypothetical protein